MKGLAGKAGIVTGGASGIGKAIAARLAAEGCKVAIFDRNAEAARAVAEELRAAGGVAQDFAVDIADAEGVEAAVAEAARSMGAPWFLVNAAGWNSTGAFLASGPEQWRRIIDINLTGALNLLHSVCSRMVEAGGGRVVCIASDAARTGASETVVYSACKGGVIALIKSLARELAPTVLINAISPGLVDTPLLMAGIGGDAHGEKWIQSVSRTIPLKRIGAPEDFTGLTALLLSDEAGYITGQTISVSGGLTMV